MRFAQRVSAITPLFCAKTDIGVIVHRPAIRQVTPLPRTPPWMRESKPGPSTSLRDTSQVAVISPMVSIITTMYTASSGRISGG